MGSSKFGTWTLVNRWVELSFSAYRNREIIDLLLLKLNRLVHLEGSNITHLRFNSSLMATISSSNRSPRRPHILNIWQLKNPKDITVHTQIQLPHDHYVELEMDEKFVVVVGEPRDAMEFNQVHIISADTHKIVRTLPYRAPLRFANASMQYHDGFLLSAEPAGIR